MTLCSVMLSHVALITFTLSFCDTRPVNYQTSSSSRRGNKLIIILLDAFRWDYFEIQGLKGFERLMKRGVKAKYMISDFPSESFPNHYSITTGLHVESHGMVGNRMYDPATNDTFKAGLGENDTDPKWWNGGEPIWITGRKHDRKSFMYSWLGCEVEIRGLRPNFCDAYSYDNGSFETNFKYMIDSGIRNLLEDGADLIGIYIEDPDHFGHRYGPFSDVLNKTVLNIDKHIDYLQDQLAEHQLTDEVNIMIMSDHGMTQLDLTKMINVTKYMSAEERERLTNNYRNNIEYPMFSLWPKLGKEEEVYELLKNENPHMQVYQKGFLPEEWHYKHNPRVAPIVVTDDIPWYMVLDTLEKHYDFKVFNDTGRPVQGGHAFGNRERDMRAIFLATGPDFKSGERDLPPVDIVDLYQMMCHVLKIPAAPNNGSWEHAASYLEDVGTYGVHSSLGLVVVVGCLFVMMF
ncbi:glycerophosphocholine cholinephosphodiesterase ENPP6-like [Lineus longissimus]|uniref:glycerophosphocholine cholinephosphodiesterase ENPP6-like n=1 Tax=Lineus longissimus TaxID=88925 RepID=UPI002B4D80CC